MDVFERRQLRLQLSKQRIIPAWVEFRTAIFSLIESYNHTDDGKLYPAKAKTIHDERAVLIENPRGRFGDEFHILTVAVTITVFEDSFLIEALKEEWFTSPQPGAVPIKKGAASKRLFHLGVDPDSGESWLAEKPEERLSPYQAAEAILGEALTLTSE